MFSIISGDENTLFGKVRAFFTLYSLVGLLLVVVLGLAAYVFYVYHNAAQQAQALSELAYIELTESMLHDDMDRRQQYLDRFAATPGIEKLHIFAGDTSGNRIVSDRITTGEPDAIERDVLRLGHARTEWLQRGLTSSIRVTRPFIASNQGAVDCLQCHQVAEGARLGGISITYSAGAIVQVAIVYTFALALLLGMFILVGLRLLRNRFEPLTAVTDDINRIVKRAVQGDFTGKIRRVTDGDIGSLAGDINQLMESLQQNIGGMLSDISSLLNHESGTGGTHNRLTTARDMVSSLVQVSRFRKDIEDEENERNIYRRIGAVLGDVFSIQRFSIYEYDAQINRLVPTLIDAEESREICYCDPEILVRADACRVIRRGEPVNNFEPENGCPMYRGTVSHSHWCLPVHQPGGACGVVQLLMGESEQARITKLRPGIEAYLREAGAVIETRRLLKSLRESSLRDPLTGLYNRRFLSEYESTLIATLKRRHTHAAILMIDLDYFKRINDNHGHIAGDQVLYEMARVIQQSVRGSDLAIRYGGEEFMLLLMDAEEGSGLKVAEKIRANIAKANVKLASAEIQSTASIGVADYPGDSDDFWKCVEYADSALYQAKERGRNRIERYFIERWGDAVEY